jgi:hypothetical protein
MTEVLPVPIAALLRSGTPLFPHEAVAVVLDLCTLVSRSRRTAGVMGVISSSTVELDASGAVSMSGGVPGEDEQSVSLVGRLLLDMLDHGTRAEAAVPPRLRATALKAATAGHEAFASLAHLAAALRRHGPEQGVASATRAVFERWTAQRRSGNASGAKAEPPRPEGPPGEERRRQAPSPDVLRRLLREAELDAYRARQEAGPAPVKPPGFDARAPEPEPATEAERVEARAQGDAEPLPKARRRSVRKLLAVGITLLLLASAGFLLLFSGQPVDMPFVAPVAKPTPVSPRREPGWELLGKPSRVSNPAHQPSVAARGRRQSADAGRQLTAPSPSHTDVAVAGR